MEKKLIIQGLEYEVEYSSKKLNKPNVVYLNDRLVVFTSHTKSSHKHILVDWLKLIARKYIEKRAKELAAKNNFAYKRIAIRDQSTRWGSCSSLGNLNFNWRLILAPKEVLDYVIIHELAHTREMNHSIRFWEIVGQVTPDYKLHKLWLKENGKSLMLLI